MTPDEIQQKLADLLDKETRYMSNELYRGTLNALITECEIRLDALRDDERRNAA